MSNAREYLDEIADILRAKGRVVEISEDTTEYGTLVWMSSLAPNWYDRTITLSAFKSARTKRWTLGTLAINHDYLKRTTRTSIRSAAEVYA